MQDKIVNNSKRIAFIRQTQTFSFDVALFKSEHSHQRCSYNHVFAHCVTIPPEECAPIDASLLTHFRFLNGINPEHTIARFFGYFLSRRK
jgi:hypothetical protein